jgi:hypothetical protein
MRYSAIDRELFACVAGIRHFRYMLEGFPFTIYTDHKPLTFALGKVSEPWTAMQLRQLSYVAEFTKDIRYRCRPATSTCGAAARCRPCSRCTWARTRCWKEQTSVSG